MDSQYYPSVCPHDCPSVCALEVEKTADGNLGKVRGSQRNAYTNGVICAKVARYSERYHHPDRLLKPLRRTGTKGDGSFASIGFDDALDEIAENFTKAAQKLGAETVWPYWYAGTMGFVQRDGVNRLTHCMGYSRYYATICVTLPDTGWKAGYGQRWGVPATEAADHSELIVVWGCNPVSTHVNVMSHIAKAKKRGAKLVVIDTYRSPTAEQADLHLAPRPGTDGALACAVMQVLLAEQFADLEYLAANSDFDAGVGDHLASRTPEWAAPITGLEPAQIRDFARLYGSTKKSWIRFGFGFTRHRNGAAVMHAASCLPIITGAWAHQGGGGMYNFGDLYHWDKQMIEGNDAINPNVRQLDQSRIGPILTGDADALKGGPPVTATLIQNTNPMCIAPDLGKVHAGFARDDLFVAVQEHFMTDTAKIADIVLPATMFLEHDDIYHASGHSTIQVARKVFEPRGECRTNHAVICGLAKRLGADHPGFAMSEWELINDVLTRSGWPDAGTVFDAGGWDALPSDEQAHYQTGFPTKTGKFQFRPDWQALGPGHAVMPKIADHLAILDEVTADKPYRLVAAPARQFLNSTFTEMASSIKREKTPKIMLHPATMQAHGLNDGDKIWVGNERGKVKLAAYNKTGMHPDTVVVESIWPNHAFDLGQASAIDDNRKIGINCLLSPDPAPPAGGAAIHDTAVWLRLTDG